ncbi:MAG: Fic family protein [Chlamydiales bacterium]|nr:Fic family protein [Chlamydiales bacterium]
MAALSLSPIQSVIELVPKASGSPIRRIPPYLFENCNQVVCKNYDPRFLALMRERVGKINEAKTPEQAEEIDWIYGLDQIERGLLQGPEKVESKLSMESIMQINGYFSRIISGKEAGRMRQVAMNWPLRDRETVDAVLQQIAMSQIFSVYGESIENDPEKLRGKVCLMKATYLTKHLKLHKQQIIQGELQLIDPSTGKPASEERVDQFKEMKDQEVLDVYNAALKLQNEKLGAQKKKPNKFLDAIQYLFDNNHFFPPPESIRSGIEASITYVQRDENHPILKACRIWYDIVRIHISHEANKRTGKAIGSAILLSYGYLPPVISKKDSNEYEQCLINGFSKGEEGFEGFVQFIVKQMIETYQMMKEAATSKGRLEADRRSVQS